MRDCHDWRYFASLAGFLRNGDLADSAIANLKEILLGHNMEYPFLGVDYNIVSRKTAFQADEAGDHGRCPWQVIVLDEVKHSHYSFEVGMLT
jgi:hypothetical protein